MPPVEPLWLSFGLGCVAFLLVGLGLGDWLGYRRGRHEVQETLGPVLDTAMGELADLTRRLCKAEQERALAQDTAGELTEHLREAWAAHTAWDALTEELREAAGLRGERAEHE